MGHKERKLVAKQWEVKLRGKKIYDQTRCQEKSETIRQRPKRPMRSMEWQHKTDLGKDTNLIVMKVKLIIQS